MSTAKPTPVVGVEPLIVTVTLEIAINEHAWTEMYGRGDAYDRAEAQAQRSLVADVEDYAFGQIAQSAAANEGAIVGVEPVIAEVTR